MALMKPNRHRNIRKLKNVHIQKYIWEKAVKRQIETLEVRFYYSRDTGITVQTTSG